MLYFYLLQNVQQNIDNTILSIPAVATVFLSRTESEYISGAGAA